MPTYKDEMLAKKRKKFVFRFALLMSIIVILAVGISYLLFFAKILDVRAVNIDAPDSLRVDLDATVGDWLNVGFWQFNRRNDILFASTSELTTRLKGQFPKIEFIKISRDFPHTLRVSATERKFIGIWCLDDRVQSEQNRCFYFDQHAIAFAEAQPSRGFLIMSISDHRARDLQLGDRVESDSWFNNIMKADDLLKRMGISVSGFVIPADSVDEFDVATADGWKIMFNNQTDIEKQISSLAGFLKEKVTPERRIKLQYVDLRIQNRIYYK